LHHILLSVTFLFYTRKNINILSCSIQSNLVSEFSGAELSAYLNSCFFLSWSIINHDTTHKIIMAQGFSRRRRMNLNVGQTCLYDSAKNEMLHRILKRLPSTHFSYVQFKSSIATYFLKIMEWFTPLNDLSTAMKLITIVFDMSRYTKYKLHTYIDSVYICTCAHIYIYMHASIQKFVRTNVLTDTYLCTCVPTYIHTYT
jgi:hypothetical protein